MVLLLYGSAEPYKVRKVIKDAVKVQVLVSCPVMFSGAGVAVFVDVVNMGHPIIHTLSGNKVM
jgi:hypothetical protein